MTVSLGHHCSIFTMILESIDKNTLLKYNYVAIDLSKIKMKEFPDHLNIISSNQLENNYYLANKLFYQYLPKR